MNTVIIVLAFLLIAFFSAKPIYKLLSHKPLYPLLPRKYNFKKRRNSFRLAMKLLKERNSRELIETGVARKGLQNTKYDGASTIVFGIWAKQNGAVLHSVDIDPAAVNEARKEVELNDLTHVVQLNVSDSVAFLHQFKKPVDFLYLDSYDYPKRDKDGQKASQDHHLKEIKAIESKLHENTLILIDDCGRRGGGKGKLVIEYLRPKGWKLIYNGYQVLMSK